MESPIRIEVVDINKILKTLPHRYPFLLIDKVINIREDFSGIGIKNVTMNEPVFQGHFPDRPVFPGVLVIEGMRQAGVVDKTGGPFGAVVVRDGEVLAVSGNSVLRDNDPSAHAEVNAIRMACKKVGAPNLRGATLFTSCECCPMCYATAYWARIGKIYYAAAWSRGIDRRCAGCSGR